MSIHIKPSHEGRLRRATGTKAGHKVSLQDEEELKAHGTPAEVKQATFAINARGWNKGTPAEQGEERRRRAKAFMSAGR